jgi:hypothetical protein
MFDKDDVMQRAIAEGIISDEQRTKLEALATSDTGDSQERFQSVGTLNEIFVTVGVILLTTALGGLIAMTIKSVVLNTVISAVISVVTAEYFHRRKRFRLPIFYAAISCAYALATAEMMILLQNPSQMFHTDISPYIWIATLAIAMLTLAAFTRRYVLPVLMLPICALFTALITVAAQMGDNALPYKLILGFSGLMILAFAIRCDLRDPKRVTRSSDYAFWSYMVGSPLFVHSLFFSVLLAGQAKWAMSGGAWLATLVLVIAVSFVGVLLNRRALIISTLIYVAYIVGRALAGLFADHMAAVALITLFIIGAYVVSLGSRWGEVRAFVMRSLPCWKWLERLPPAA